MSTTELELKFLKLFNGKVVGTTGFTGSSDISSTETDIRIVVVGFVIVELGEDGLPLSLFPSRFPMWVDIPCHPGTSLEVAQFLGYFIAGQECR